MSSSKADVIIIGAGIFGLSCAYALAKRSVSVRVYDAGLIGDGASGGIVGALSPHTPDQWNPKKQFQYEALSDAAAFWQEVDKRAGLSSGYGRIGRWIPILSERELALAQSRIETAKTHWGEAFSYRILPRPEGMTSGEFGVVHETLSARLFPKKAVASLAQACRVLGVRFYENHRVEKLSSRFVSGPWGEDQADAIILAGGVEGFAFLDARYGIQTGQGVKGQAALLTCDLPNGQPQIFADGLYIIPHEDGSVAIGSTSENQWDDPLGTDHQLEDLIARAIAVLPVLKDAHIVQRWAGLRPKARRRDPMLGAMRGLPNVYCAMGGFKIGFGIAPKIGEVLADLILEGKDQLPPSFTLDHHLS